MNPGEIAASPSWEAAGWTMIHLGWVGVLIGLLAAVLRRLLRKSRPEARHGAALACLLALTAAPVAIFPFVYRPEVAAPRLPDPDRRGPVSAAPVSEAMLSLGGPGLRGMDVPVPASGLRSGGVAAFKPFVAWLPGVWIGGSLGTLALLATGLIGVERLRRSSPVLDAGPIAARCRELARALGIARRVGVAVCDRLAAPILVGVIRPMVLLPPAALSGWSVEQVEMALLHELAHLRRRDNLVNLLQRIVESLFFFHPVTWWLSAWVRLEREHCCDRLVVERTGRPCEYARMLASLAGSGRPRQQPAPAMAERPLMTRIRRILDMEDRSMRMTLPEGLGLVAAAILGASMTLGASAGPPPADRDDDAGRRALARMAAEAATIPDREADRDRRGETLVSIAKAQFKLGDRDGAVATLRRFDEVTGTLHFPPDAAEGLAAWSRFENLLESIRIRRTAGDLDGARSALDRASRLQESFDEATVRAAFSRMQGGVEEAARKESDGLQVVGAGEGAGFMMEMSYIIEVYPTLIEEQVAIGNEDEARRLIRRYLRAIEPVKGPFKAAMLGHLGRMLIEAGEEDEGREVIEQARRETLALEGPLAERIALPALVCSMADAGDMDGALALLRGKSPEARQRAIRGIIQGLTVDDHRIPWLDPSGIKITIGDQSLTPKDPATARALLPKIAGFVRPWEDAKAKARTLAVVAHLQARAGDFAGAVETAEAIPDLKRADFPGPSDGFYDAVKPATFAIVAELQAEAGDHAAATAAFDRARALASSVGAEDQKLIAQIVIAQKQAGGGRYADAKAIIVEATPLALDQPEPRRSRALVMLAEVQIKVGDLDGALRAADAARAQPGIEKVRILSGLGLAYEEAGDMAKSAELSRQAHACQKPGDHAAPAAARMPRSFTRESFLDFDLEFDAAMVRSSRDAMLLEWRMRSSDAAALIRDVRGLPADSRDSALADIGGHLARRGDVAGAMEAVGSIESPAARLGAFASLAFAVPEGSPKR